MNSFDMNSIRRRDFIKATGITAGGLIWRSPAFAEQRRITIKDVRMKKGIAVEADDGTIGKFAGSSEQDLKVLERHLPRIRELLVGKNALDVTLAGETLWEAIYPGRAKLFGEGRDPLTGELILNKPRSGRQTATGRVFIAFSTVDIALWDLRAQILKKPAYQIIGPASAGACRFTGGRARSESLQPRRRERRAGVRPRVSQPEMVFQQRRAGRRAGLQGERRTGARAARGIARGNADVRQSQHPLQR